MTSADIDIREATKSKHKIGEGAFSKVYRLDEDNVLIKSICHAKECMAHGWFPDSDLFPEIEMVDRDGEFFFYKMRYYPTAKDRGVLKKLDERNKRLYKELQRVHEKKQDLDRETNNEHLFFNNLHTALDAMSDEFEEEREALKEATDAMGNFTAKVGFEISPRNVATEDGQLILLDCFFSVEQLKKVRLPAHVRP